MHFFYEEALLCWRLSRYSPFSSLNEWINLFCGKPDFVEQVEAVGCSMLRYRISIAILGWKRKNCVAPITCAWLQTRCTAHTPHPRCFCKSKQHNNNDKTASIRHERQQTKSNLCSLRMISWNININCHFYDFDIRLYIHHHQIIFNKCTHSPGMIHTWRKYWIC